jgi:hypothetical protein
MSDFVPVYKPSFVVEEQASLIRITTEMPKREKVAVYISVAALLILALGFLLITPLTIFSHQTRIAGIASFLNLSFYAVIFLALTIFVTVIGIRRTFKQIIEVTGDSLTILEGSYKYYFRPKRYAIKFVKNLRGSTYPNKKEGAVKFDYGSQTIIFGKSIEEAEANLIVQAIVTKYPNLKP